MRHPDISYGAKLLGVAQQTWAALARFDAGQRHASRPQLLDQAPRAIREEVEALFQEQGGGGSR